MSGEDNKPPVLRKFQHEPPPGDSPDFTWAINPRTLAMSEELDVVRRAHRLACREVARQRERAERAEAEVARLQTGGAPSPGAGCAPRPGGGSAATQAPEGKP